MWDRLVPDLLRRRVATHWNRETLAVFCECVAAFQKARDLLGAGLLLEPGFSIEPHSGGSVIRMAQNRYGHL